RIPHRCDFASRNRPTAPRVDVAPAAYPGTPRVEQHGASGRGPSEGRRRQAPPAVCPQARRTPSGRPAPDPNAHDFKPTLRRALDLGALHQNP
ncbi:MAG: hypothetical protein AAFX50_06740, partial [Acidobacteriota bacterium]